MSDTPSIPSSPVSSARPNLSAVVNEATGSPDGPSFNKGGDGKGWNAKDKGVKVSAFLNPPDVQEKLKNELSSEKTPEPDDKVAKVPETVAEQKDAEKVADKLDAKPGLNAELNDDGTITLKMGDKEEKVTIAEAKKLAQMGKNAHNTWNDANKIKKTAEFQLGQVKELMKFLQSNTKDVLYDPRLKIDLQALTNALIEDQINWKNNPTSKENYYLKREKEDRQYAEQQAQQKQETETKSANESALIQTWTNKINNAMIESGLKGEDPQANKLISDQIVRYLAQAINNGIELEPEDVIPQVKKDLTEYLNRLMVSMPEDQLEKTVPPALLERIRKINMSKLSGPEKKAEIKKVVQSEVAPAVKKIAKPRSTKMTPFEVKAKPTQSQRETFKSWINDNEKQNS